VELIWFELRKRQHLQSKLACGQPTGRRDTLKDTFLCALQRTIYSILLCTDRRCHR